MNTTKEAEFDYQTYLKENRPDPARINRGPKARQKRREAVVCNIRGFSHYEDGRYDCAIDDFTKAIDAKADFAEGYNNRGEAWLHLSEWDKAREDLATAKEKGEDIIAAFRNDYESVADFEKKNDVNLPDDIAALLEGTGE